MKEKFDLNSISRGKLNKLVQRYILSNDIKNFSSYLTNTSREKGVSLPHDQILASIQNGLYGENGKNLKDDKNIPRNGIVPDYMSSMELIRYRDAINLTKERYKDLIERGFFYSRYIQGDPIEIGRQVEREFRGYRNFFNFIYTGGESINSGIVKDFNKALKLKLYHKVLTIIPGKNKHGFANDFNPYYEKFNDYEQYRKKFVQVVDYFSKFNFPDSEIKKLFRAYEKTYYNTNFLEEKNIDIINYTLGLSKGAYFSKKDLEVFEKCVDYLMDVVIEDFRDYDETINYLEEKAAENREKYIDENMKDGKRPENSDIFLVACLDKIVEKKRKEGLKDMKIVQVEPFSNAEYSTKNILDLPDSIKEISKMVAKSIEDKRKQITSKPPSMFDLGLIEEKPSTPKVQDHCQ